MDGTIAPASPEAWGLARRLGFRFAFCYLALNFYGHALGLLPWPAPARWNQQPASQMAFGQPEDPAAPPFELELVWNDAEHLDVAGELEGQLIVAQLKKRAFLLETRGFHWINETPFNR